jgi:hypothetical protein
MITKGQMDPHSKLAQVAPHISPHREPCKLTESFGHHAFKGEGDFFSSSFNFVNACLPKPQRRNENSPTALATARSKARVTLSQAQLI